MHLGLLTSLLVHAALIGWALITIRATPPLKMPEQTPVEVAIITNDDLVRLTKGERTAKRLEADGGEPVIGSSADFAALIRSEIATWTKVFKTTGIVPE